MEQDGDQEARGSVVLVAHTTSYNVEAFVWACQGASAQPVIASDRCHVLDGVWKWPADALLIDFYDPAAAAAAIATEVQRRGLPPIRAVIPVGGEVAALVASLATARLGLTGNAPAAAEATANKLRMRELCAAARGGAEGGVVVPAFRAFAMEADPREVAVAVGESIGWPCVLKPLLLSASRGVMRADDAATFVRAWERLRALLSAPALLKMGGDGSAARQILVEAFVAGPEVAVEALLSAGQLTMLALFDKPDPMEGPFFEETIYVTPSRHPVAVQAEVEKAVERAARALGMVSGPVHAEVRLSTRGPVVIEVAARSIGGLCSRTLRFGTGLSLEDLVVRHALGDVASGTAAGLPARDGAAAGVMMIPIPRAGILKSVAGIEKARAVAGIEDVVISIRPGETLVPLPEGASYLGFIFARGPAPEVVEAALRTAHRHLAFEVAPLLPVS